MNEWGVRHADAHGSDDAVLLMHSTDQHESWRCQDTAGDATVHVALPEQLGGLLLPTTVNPRRY